jgi:hypothetical protein
MPIKFSESTLELFSKYRWGLRDHLDEVNVLADKAELNRVLALSLARKLDRCSCEGCSASLSDHGVVCSRHYHDYVECDDDGCWTCYVSRVMYHQLGIDIGF